MSRARRDNCPLYGTVTDRALPHGATAVDYLELAMAALDQVGVPLGPVVRALPDPQRWEVLSIAWVKRALETG